MKITPIAAAGQAVPTQVSQAPVNAPEPVKVAPTAPETAAETTPSQPVATPDVSKASTAELEPRFKELAVKEQTIRSAAKKLKEREAEYKANYISKADLAKDLLGTLTAAGISIPSASPQTDAAPVAAPDALAAKIDSLQAEILALKEGKQADQKSAYDSAVKQLQRETDSLVSASDEFSTIKASKRTGDVVELIEKNFKATGEVLSVKDAAKLVEDALLEEYKPLLASLQAKLKPAPAEPEAIEAPADSKIVPKKHGMPVKITQRDAKPTSNLTHKLNSNRPLSAKERAMKAFRGEE